MNISSLSESYQDMIYKVYQESTPESDFPYGHNFYSNQCDLLSEYYKEAVISTGYVSYEGEQTDVRNAGNLNRLREYIAHFLGCNIVVKYISRHIYVRPELLSNSFPEYIYIHLSNDRYIYAYIYLSNFGSYYFLESVHPNISQDEKVIITSILDYLFKTYNYRNIFDDYTESDLQQILPIYGAHHGSPLTSEYRDRYNLLKKSPHFINHLSNESAMHTHWTYLYQSELGFPGEWEEHMDELDDIVLSQEVMHHIWLLTQDINSNSQSQSKINITAEGKVTPFPFRLRDLLFGEFLTITECRHIQAEIMSKFNGILKKKS